MIRIAVTALTLGLALAAGGALADDAMGMKKDPTAKDSMGMKKDTMGMKKDSMKKKKSMGMKKDAMGMEKEPMTKDRTHR